MKQEVVLSVSFEKGCYRHIAVPMSNTLEELAEDILFAFDFFNDHAHAFFMNNRAWDSHDCYMMAEVAEDEPTTNSVTLSKLGLYKDMKFLFVFDFGENYRFQCKVLKIQPQKEDSAYIVRRVGESPEQYPAWEDE